MKTALTILGGLGLLALFALPVAATVYGLYLAFSASIILGVVVLLVEPAPLILGVLGFLGHPEVSEKIVQFIQGLLG
mgnify:CR=1 FL=1